MQKFDFKKHITFKGIWKPTSKKKGSSYLQLFNCIDAPSRNLYKKSRKKRTLCLICARKYSAENVLNFWPIRALYFICPLYLPSVTFLYMSLTSLFLCITFTSLESSTMSATVPHPTWVLPAPHINPSVALSHLSPTCPILGLIVRIWVLLPHRWVLQYLIQPESYLSHTWVPQYSIGKKKRARKKKTRHFFKQCWGCSFLPKQMKFCTKNEPLLCIL
jgi:hypothetical protein